MEKNGVIYHINEDGVAVVTGYAGESGDMHACFYGNAVIVKVLSSDSKPIKTINISTDGNITFEFGAFYGHPTLENLTVTGKEVAFKGWSFQYCKALSSVVVFGKVSEIGKEAFSLSKALTSFTIMEKSSCFGARIEKEAFLFCDSLHLVSIQEGTTFIGERAFNNCPSLERISIPKSVTSIGEDAFGFGLAHDIWIICEKGSYAEKYARENDYQVECSLNTGASPSSSSSSQTSGGCYIATAVYGSYDCPEVWVLRRFRDSTLMPSPFGRAFVRAYYATSPTIIKHFGNVHLFKTLIKPLLDKKVANLKKKGISDKPYNDKQ